MKLKVFLLVILSTLLAGCTNQAHLEDPSHQSTTQNEWKTYINPIAEWSIQHPNDWKVSEYIDEQATNVELMPKNQISSELTIELGLTTWKNASEMLNEIMSANSVWKPATFNNNTAYISRSEMFYEGTKCLFNHCKSIVFSENQIFYIIEYDTDNKSTADLIEQMLRTFSLSKKTASEISTKIPDPSN